MAATTARVRVRRRREPDRAVRGVGGAAQITVQGQPFKVQLLDTMGQERYRSLMSGFFRVRPAPASGPRRRARCPRLR